jgi:MFS family permease
MRQQWILRLALLTQLATAGILFTFEAVRMKDMGLGEATIGLILASGSGVFILSSLFWGRLADRHHCHKRIVIYGTLGLVALMLYFSFCTSALQFFLYAVTRAILIPMIMGIMPALAVSAIGKNKRGSQFGIYRAFGSLGFILGTMVLPLVFNDLAVAARAAALILLSSLLLLRKLPEPEKDNVASVPLRLRTLDPLISLFLFSFFFVAIPEPALAGFFFAYARELEGSTRLLGLLSGAMGLVAFISLPIMGRLVDRSSPSLILAIAFFAQSLRVFCTSLVSDPNYLWIPLLLHGITWGGVEVSAVLYLASLVKEDQKATVLSFYMAIRMLGQLTGASLSGYLAETHGYTFMFRVITAVALLGALIYVTGGLLLRRRQLSQP